MKHIEMELENLLNEMDDIIEEQKDNQTVSDELLQKFEEERNSLEELIERIEEETDKD